MPSMTKVPPLISVITPSFNRVDMIGQAIGSVMDQNFLPVEHIIVDGGSTDGTLELLAQFPHLIVISEPDHSMYDALNKGLKLAQGEMVGFLNTDDLYAPGILEAVAASFSDPSVDAVAGKASVFFENTDGKSELMSEVAPAEPDGLLERVVLEAPDFNAWFFRRGLFEKIGAFDARYRFTGDREFMIRVALAGINYVRLDRLICKYRRHSGALTFNWGGTFFLEVVQEHLKMVDRFLSRNGLPEHARYLLQKLRTRDTVNLVITLIRRRSFAMAWYYARLGLRHDRNWPQRFIVRVFFRLTHPGQWRSSHA
jgi:glycosyltransferase involved in cell wall biosynthesis